VAGDVPRPLSLSTADLKSMMRRTVTVTVEGRTITYAGVRAADVLTRAGAPLGRELRGEALATYVLATAKDGYQVVFSLGELDPAVAPSDILIADTADGQPLADAQGPFRIVAPHDQRAVRGVRMLQRLDVVSVRST
jgi:DMSO/TMAO reductase YedYZ molybdopterin-dependent catalytic subunit